MKRIIALAFTASVFSSCTKEMQTPVQISSLESAKAKIQKPDIENAVSATAVTGYTLYTIKKGGNYSDKSVLKSVKTSEMKFYASFDNSAVYTNVLAANQYDINKLWGFSEGFNNQYNSCRIGWSWNDGIYGGVYNIGTKSLRLSAYSYAKGVRYSKEICTVPLNTDIYCSIKLVGALYSCTITFTEGGISKKFNTTITRGLSTTSASGYQQYPYFGGDEVAPQDIFIKIKPM